MKPRVIATAELVDKSRPRLESDAISSMFTSPSGSLGRRTQQRTNKPNTPPPTRTAPQPTHAAAPRPRHKSAAEPLRRDHFGHQRGPTTDVATRLARIYLTSYRLPQAAVAIERWRTLAPEDPQPYLWSNEVAARSDVEPSVLIR